MIKTKQQRIVYQNRFVTVFDDDVIFPDGHEGTYFRHQWKAPHGVVIAPVCADRVLLLWNHRYGDATPHLEVPQGFGVNPSDIEADARRELLEETGCAALKLERLAVYGGDGYKDYVFEATLPEGAEPNARRAEATEDVAGFQWLNLDDIAPASLQALGITNQATITALLLVKLRRASRAHVSR